MKEKSYMLALPGEQEPEGRMEVLRRLKNAPDFKVVTADTEDEGSLELTVEYKGNRYRALQRTVKIDIFVFGVKGSTAYKTGPSYWMPISCAGLIFSSGKSFRHHTLSLSIKYETTSTYCFKRDLRNMRFPAR